MSNTFAMTALLIVLGMVGKTDLAADVGIVQGAMLALFYAFSANARNIILNSSTPISMRSMLVSRLILSVPLGVLTFYLSVYVADVASSLSLALIIRRCVEWIGELHLSEIEVRDRREFALRYICLQLVIFFLAVSWMLGSETVPLVGVFLWATVPILMSVGFLQKHLTGANHLQTAWSYLLPHFGSSSVTGIAVYVFRILILSFAGKSMAGSLFAAFAIGGILGSVFSNALGPSVVLHEARSGQRGLPRLLKKALFLWSIGGIGLFLATEFAQDSLSLTTASSMFWSATGLSMIGGVVMVFAQRARLRLLQQYVGKDVFGADVLVNILIVAYVPYLFFLVGGKALIFLYLINAVVALIFYFSSEQTFLRLDSEGFSSSILRKGIAALIIFPLFFQLTGNIFHDQAIVFDSEGAFQRLPIPFSVFACYGGIVLLGGYQRALPSLWFLFLSFVFILMSSVVTTQGLAAEQQGKLLLMLQFVLPMFGIVLGQVYEFGENNPAIFEKTFLYVLVVLVPCQLLATWVQGSVMLSPYLYIFSIYQQLQYVPVIFICCYLLTLFSLWKYSHSKKILIFLSPVMGLYAVASMSSLSIIILIVGMLGFTLYQLWGGLDKSLLIILSLLFVAAISYVMVLQNTGMFLEKFAFLAPQELASADQGRLEKLAPNVSERLYFWKYYLENSVSDYKVFLIGHAERPDRTDFPSAHNYYLDFLYNFGFLALIPLLALILYTLFELYRLGYGAFASPSLVGLSFVVFVLLFVDNSLKVGLRQPYPGIISFFLWGVLLSRLSTTHSTTGSQLRSSAT